MPMLKALKSFGYGGKTRRPGDVFPARSERDAKLLVNVGQCERAPETPPAALLRKPAKPVVQAVVVAPVQAVAQPEVAADPAPAPLATEPAAASDAPDAAAPDGDSPGKSRRYKRRDMQAHAE